MTKWEIQFSILAPLDFDSHDSMMDSQLLPYTNMMEFTPRQNLHIELLAWIHDKVGVTMNPQSCSQTPQCHSTHWIYCPNDRCLGYSNIHFINWLTEAWWKSLPYHVSILLYNKTIHTSMKNKTLPVTQHLFRWWLATDHIKFFPSTRCLWHPLLESHLMKYIYMMEFTLQLTPDYINCMNLWWRDES